MKDIERLAESQRDQGASNGRKKPPKEGGVGPPINILYLRPEKEVEQVGSPCPTVLGMAIDFF